MAEAGPKSGLGVVVNFFVKSAADPSCDLIVATTEVGLRCLAGYACIDEVLLVDGSEQPCEAMRSACAQVGVRYLHGGQRLSYVEAYNLGWRSLRYDIVGFMANDIIPEPADTVDRLLAWVRQPGVGCTFPYMVSNRAHWDEVQRPGFLDRGAISCEPSTMTLNLNLIRRALLEEIGGLDENYRGGYQEPILLSKLRGAGHRVVMVGGASVFHFDRLTKAVGQSEIGSETLDRDSERWFREYPEHASERGLAGIRVWARPFSTRRLQGWAWRLAAAVPYYPLRRRLIEVLLWLEPMMCRVRDLPDASRLQGGC